MNKETIEAMLLAEYPKGVELYYVDYRDELSEAQVQKIFNGEDVNIFEDWDISDNINFILDVVFTKKQQKEIEEQGLDLWGIVSERCNEHDTSNPYEQLCRNTGPVRVRVQLHSNNDCGNSDRLQSQEGYTYEGSYLGDVIDFLGINPQEMKQLLVSTGRTCYGKRPNKKRTPLVTAKDLLSEMKETTAGWVACFAGVVDLANIKEGGIKVIELPAGTPFGCHNDRCGTCSGFDAVTLHNKYIVLDFPIEGKSTCDVVSIKRDSNGYGIDEVCGMSSSFWSKEILIDG